ncbi:MAG: metal ABC transporter substrate-binding protein [Anaerolineales bacterium]
MRRFLIPLLLVVAIMLGCSPRPAGSGKLQVVATTGIVADVVRQVGGEFVEVTTLLPPGTDAHSYTSRPEDVVMLSKARLVFANGAGLEEFLAPLLENAGAKERLVEVSNKIPLLEFEMKDEHEEQHEQHDHAAGGEHKHAFDPHTWFSPKNVILWVDTIAEALSQADPAHRATYQKNAEAYKAQLQELDAWIADQVAQIPPQNRKLVTDHRIFGYFARDYGFEQIGAIIPSFSTEASPSAQELATLEDAIRAYGVKAIFVEEIGNQQLAEQVSRDTGVRLVALYHDLGPAGSEADTYLKYMRYNVAQIVEALK